MESPLQSKIIKDLNKKKGCFAYKQTASVNGVPDICACYRGKYVAIEVKDEGKKPTLLQEYVIDEVIVTGAEGIAFWCDSWKMYKEKWNAALQ